MAIDVLYCGYFDENKQYLGNDARALFIELLSGKTRSQQLRYLEALDLDDLVLELTSQGRKVKRCVHCGFVFEFKSAKKTRCESCRKREYELKRLVLEKTERALEKYRATGDTGVLFGEFREEFGDGYVVYWMEEAWLSRVRNRERPQSTDYLDRTQGAEMVWDKDLGVAGKWVPRATFLNEYVEDIREEMSAHRRTWVTTAGTEKYEDYENRRGNH